MRATTPVKETRFVVSLGLAAFLMAGAVNPALAVGSVRAVLDRKEVPLHETFTFTMITPSECTAGNLPRSGKYEIIKQSRNRVQAMGRMKSSMGKSGINRGSSSTLHHSYFLRATAMGDIVFAPISASCGSSIRKTFQTSIKVIEPLPRKEKQGGTQAKGGKPDLYDKPVSIQSFTPKTGPLSGAIPSPVEDDDKPKLVSPSDYGAAEPDPDPESAAARKADQSVRFVFTYGKEVAKHIKLEHLKLIGKIAAGAFVAFIIGMILWKLSKSKAYERALERVNEKYLARPSAKPAEASRTDAQILGGKYEILLELGSGGMGKVYLAQDLYLKRKVAIKALRAELRRSDSERESFIKEARLVSQLNHPYIVGIHEILEMEEQIYIVFDYIDGKLLSAYIRDRKRLPLKDAVAVLAQVCQAVDYAHKNNVLHQDLKPSNIMIDKNGYAKVMDFGLAREARESSSDTGPGGTLWYMSPEQHMGTTAKSSDVYALGICLYEMVTGVLPFPGTDCRQKKDRAEFIPPSQLVPELPKEIDRIVASALVPTPEMRVPSAIGLLEKLKPFAG